MKNSVFHTLRGGSYVNDSWRMRTADRVKDVPECRVRDLGFRIVVQRKP